MARDIETACGLVEVDEQERRLLTGRERPVVLLRKRQAAVIAEAVAPGNVFLGVMLPYTPLHQLLCAELPPVVMTSGNLSDEPIVCDNSAASRRLAPLVDGFLMHDREIRSACDDSVVRCVAGKAMPSRRSRGHAPLPILLGRDGPGVLAVGGELKAAICVARDDRAWMSQHIGDMGNVETPDALVAAAGHLLRLFRVEPEAIVADLHPGYLSTGWARRFAADRGIPLVQVQHHEAHLAALLAEHGGRDHAIGVCFDGTGYGRDGTIWGGSFSRCGATCFAGPRTSPLFRCRAAMPASIIRGGRPWRCCTHRAASGMSNCRRWLRHRGGATSASEAVGRDTQLRVHEQHGAALRRRGGAGRRTAVGDLRG